MNLSDESAESIRETVFYLFFLNQLEIIIIFLAVGLLKLYYIVNVLSNI